MALKLYDKITPSDDFALVDAEHVEMSDGSRLDVFVSQAVNQVIALDGRVEKLETFISELKQAEDISF